MKGVSNYMILIMGVLIIGLIALWPIITAIKGSFSSQTENVADVIARELRNVVEILDGFEQGVYIYTLPTDTYEIKLNANNIAVTNRNVDCTFGCGFTYEHNAKYAQASHIPPGVKTICVVRKYREDGLPIIYICDNENKDLRCDCNIDRIQGVEKGVRYTNDNEVKCSLELKELDNYGEVGDSNTVKMTVETINCQGMYLSPFGTPYKEWVFGDEEIDDWKEEKFTALRYKITKDCLKGISNPSKNDLEDCQTLINDKDSRTITEENVEVILEYVCKEDKGNDFLFDLIAYPSDGNYELDIIARIQTYVGCGEKPTPKICTKGCKLNKKCGDGKYFCNRELVYSDFCVPAYYDTNCHS